VYLCSYDRTLSDACASLADKWNECDVADLSQFKPVDIEQFSAYQKKAFLGLLLQHVSLPTVYIRTDEMGVFISARCNIYISRLCYDVSVHLSVCDGSALAYYS